MSNFGDHPAGFFGDSSFYNGVATTSLRLDDGSAAHLHRTPAADSSDAARKKYTFSTWVKRASLGTTQQILAIGSGAGGAPWFFLYFLTSDQIQAYWYSTTSGNATNSSPTFAPVLRDTSAWYNIVLAVDTTDGTATDRFKLYINGVRAAVATAGNALLQNFIGVINSNIKHYIGSNANTEQYLDAYLSDTNMIDGTALGPDSFGEFKNGIWIPIDTSGLTFGANGFRLQYTSQAHDAPASEGDADTDNIGADSSGENNHWTALDAIVASDCAMPDSPENNFCTLNPLELIENNSGAATSKGNLKWSNVNALIDSTFGFGNSGGKYYWEYLYVSSTDGNHYQGVTLQKDGISITNAFSTGIALYFNDGTTRVDGTSGTGFGAQIGADNIIQFKLDLDNGTLQFGKNNTYITALTLPTSIGGWRAGGIQAAGSGGTRVFVVNYGQDSSFAGTKTAQGNTDENGLGDFFYAVPSGFLAVCSANLPEPTIGPNSTTQADDHFNTVLYTGGSSGQGITGVGFKPDWTWIKSRSHASSHVLTDSSRGVTESLFSDTTGAESTLSGGVTAFGTDGFTLGTEGTVNTNTRTYVAWNWKANGGTATATISESGNNPAAVVQANPTAGFSIVAYTGTQAAGTIAHGLGAVPKMMIFKNRAVDGNGWIVYHAGNTAAPETDFLFLDNTNATADNANRFNDTAPTNSVFTLGADANINDDGVACIGFIFAEVEGYSKFGTYTANGVDDGSFVHLGFRPSFVMLKNTSNNTNGGNWVMMDDTRLGDDVGAINPILSHITANTNAAEFDSASYPLADFLSNGFKLRLGGTGSGVARNVNNAAGNIYIYMAFASSPFKYANAF